jgi:hypothetical protein
MRILKAAGFSYRTDYYFVGGWDTISPINENDGPKMAEAISDAKIHPKAEPYYCEPDNQVVICGYGR